jgi:hypothetical protein
MKANLAAAVSMLFLVVLLVETQSFAVDGQAQPTPFSIYHHGDPYTTVYKPKQISVPNDAKSSTITILSPENHALVAQNSTTLVFNLTVEAKSGIQPVSLTEVCYKPSWQPNNITVDLNYPSPIVNKTFQLSVNAVDIPEGNQSITVYASAICQFETSRELVYKPVSPSGFIQGTFLYINSYFYILSTSSTVNFSVDTTPPTPTSSATPDHGSTQFLRQIAFFFIVLPPRSW